MGEGEGGGDKGGQVLGNGKKIFLFPFFERLFSPDGHTFDGPDHKGRKGDGHERDQGTCCGRSVLS